MDKPETSRRDRRSNSAMTSRQQQADSSPQKQQVPGQVLKQLAADVLEHTKRLGLFDEMRIKLIDEIESSRDFEHIRKEFNREVESFCRSADLSLPRSKLRERLLSLRTMHNSTELIKSHVVGVARRHKQQMRNLYERKARAYLATSSLEPAISAEPVESPSTCCSKRRSNGRRQKARQVKSLNRREKKNPWTNGGSISKERDRIAT